MTKADLVNEIAIATGFDKTTISAVVESYMKIIKNSLSEGENVYLRGFGSFIAKTRKAKVARNISQSTSIRVPAHKIASFKPATEFAKMMRAAK